MRRPRIVEWAADERTRAFHFCQILQSFKLKPPGCRVQSDKDRIMPSPFTRVVWNKFEAALLVDAYVKVSNGEVLRNDAVSQLSKRLRYRMIINGLEVNDKYRNENGIQLQMATVEYIMTNGEKGVSSPNQLFDNVVNMYVCRYEEFQKLLDEALALYPKPVDNHVYKIETADDVNSAVEEVNVSDTILLNRIKCILSSKFPKGMRLNSAIDKRRFRNYYSETTGSSCELSDGDLTAALKKCGVESDGKVYVADHMLPMELKYAIGEFIDDSLASGRDYIFYECIFLHFKNQLLDTPIANDKLLCTYLKYCYEDKLFFGPDYMATDSSVEVDIDKIVIDYMHEQWQVMTEDEVVEALSYLPEDAVRNAFNRNQNVLIGAGVGRRFHIDKFEISDEELSKISSAIDSVVNEFHFMGGDELVRYVQQSVPSVITNNTDIPELGIRKALSVLLADKFDFNSAVVSRKGEKLSARDALLAYARSHDSYTLSEVKNLAQSLGTTLNYHLESLLQYSVRVNETDFVAKDKVEFDVEKTDAFIQNLIDRSVYCCSISQINNFMTFPECNYNWTPRLLESYLLTESKLFRLYVSGSLSQNKVCGAVSYKADFMSFKFLMGIVLAESDSWTNKAEALDYLASEGFLAHRQYADIDAAMNDAMRIRNLRNNNN